MLHPLKRNIFLKIVENKQFFFINTFLFTLSIGLFKFFNFSINYLLLYLFFFNLFFLKFQKLFFLKNITIFFLLSAETLYLYFLNKFDISQLTILLFFNFFIISLIIKEIPVYYVNGLKIGIYIIFILDIVIMLTKITTGNFLGHFSQLEVFYNYEYWPGLRVNGLLQSPILSSILSIIVFLFSFYHKDKLFIFLSILFSNLSGSYRALFFILLFLIIYYVFLFFLKKEKFCKKISAIVIISFFSFLIVMFYIGFNSFKTSVKIRYLMFIEYKNCYLSTEICKKDLSQKEKESKHKITHTNKKYYGILEKIQKNNPELKDKLINHKKYKGESSEIIDTIEKLEYLSQEDKEITIYVTLLNENLTSLTESYNLVDNEEVVNNRVKLLLDAKIFENYYLTNIANYGFITIIFRLLLFLYLLLISIKKFITYQYKNIFSFSLIISISLSSFIDTIIFSYLFVIYVWTFLFFIINQNENFDKKKYKN
jgi:hypothetical protein